MKHIVCLLLMLVCCCTLTLATADVSPKVNVLAPDEVREPGYGQHFYLLLCQDTWQEHASLGNTDGIVIVTLDEYAQRVMLTSIIRDALVQRPDGVTGRINYIAKNYSPEALCEVISRHLGVKIEKYILFNFSQIQAIVDILGGVDIPITTAEANYLLRYSVYAIDKSSVMPHITGAGTYHFNGYGSVVYMRIRKAGGGGDFMRTQRVRTVLSLLADQCRSISEQGAKDLAQSVLDNATRTNMSLGEIEQAAAMAWKLRGCTIEELRIPQDGMYRASNYAGMSCQELDWAACRDAFDDYLRNSFLVVDDDEEE